MKHIDNWWFPKHEEHLPNFMKTENCVVHGRLTYQHRKYIAAKKYVKNFRKAIDIGGHIGLWSFVMAHDFTQVLAFEPMANHRKCFELNTKILPNIKLYDCALGEKNGTCALITQEPESSGNTKIIPNLSGKIKIKKLDTFEFDDVDFIKIDCEGFEEFVLRGGVETIKKCKPCIIVEQKRDMSKHYGLKKQSAVTFLQDMGANLRMEISGDYILSWD